MVSNSVILILLDGLGIGERENPANPLLRFAPRVLRLFSDRLGPFPADGRGLRTDVSLGVPGLPQSATNHVTLLTGLNAAAALGRHLSGFPNRFFVSCWRSIRCFFSSSQLAGPSLLPIATLPNSSTSGLAGSPPAP